jgi:hypothetical protein
MKEYTSNL